MLARPRRPRYRGLPRRAELRFIVLLSDPHVDDALKDARARIADEAVANALTIDLRSRSTDQGRLDEALGGRARFAVEALPAGERAQLARASRYLWCEASPADPPTHELLEAVMVTLRAVAEADCLLAALDETTARLWTPDALVALPADRLCALDEHVRVGVEVSERRAGVGHLLRTYGLTKFARPDVGARGPRGEIERLGELLHGLAELLYQGEPIELGDRVSLPGLPPLTPVPRSADCLEDAPADRAALYELRDAAANGRAEATCERALSTLRPRR
jgi:hypothetical protein